MAKLSLIGRTRFVGPHDLGDDTDNSDGIRVMDWGRFFGRQSPREEIRPGSVYRRIWPDKTVETATVVAVREDCFGIPHVRYRLCFGLSGSRSYNEGTRVLSLASFSESYRRVAQGGQAPKVGAAHATADRLAS